LLATRHPAAAGERVGGGGLPPAIAVKVGRREANRNMDALVLRPLRARREVGDCEVEVPVDSAGRLSTELVEEQPAARRHAEHGEDCSFCEALAQALAGELRILRGALNPAVEVGPNELLECSGWRAA